MFDRDSLTPQFVGAASASAFGCGRKAALVNCRRNTTWQLDGRSLRNLVDVHLRTRYIRPS